MERENTIHRWDRSSFYLGMINCFVEMVAAGVKKLALSPPLVPEEYSRINRASDKIANAFGIKSYLEKSLLITELQSDEFTSGKWNILYYEDDLILDAYHALKKKQQNLIESGDYSTDARREISREFMTLLSYSKENIKKILSRKEPTPPYLLIDDPEEQT